MGTPFNPSKYAAQQGIVDNLKLQYQELHNIGVIAAPLTLQDAEIWDSYDSFGDAEAEDDVFPELRNRYDAMVLEDMKYKQEQAEIAASNTEMNVLITEEQKGYDVIDVKKEMDQQ